MGQLLFVCWSPSAWNGHLKLPPAWLQKMGMTFILIHTHIHIHRFSLSLSNTHTHACTLSHKHTHSLSLSLSLSLSHTHTHTHTTSIFVGKRELYFQPHPVEDKVSHFGLVARRSASKQTRTRSTSPFSSKTSASWTLCSHLDFHNLYGLDN